MKTHCTRSLGKLAARGVLLGALAFASGCGPQYHLNYEVWEAPGQTSSAHKKWIGGIGGYHEEAIAALKANDVDKAIQLVEAGGQKSYFDYYNLAVLYEVKHDWAKAEAAILAAIQEHDSKFHKPHDLLQSELAYIQDHKARYVYTPLAAPPPAEAPMAPMMAPPAAPPAAMPAAPPAAMPPATP